MNTISSLFEFLGNTLGANPSTLSTTSKTVVGSINEIAAKLYPVGCYYWTSDSGFNPATSFGGTWEKMDEGMVLVSAGTNYTISAGTSKDGGDATVTLTTSELPAHTHNSKTLTGSFWGRKHGSSLGANIGAYSGICSGGSDSSTSFTGATSNDTVSSYHPNTIVVNATHEHDSVGGGDAHNNMPPYKNAFCWHRTA